jgi:PAS domain S-box-containing protein
MRTAGRQTVSGRGRLVVFEHRRVGLSRILRQLAQERDLEFAIHTDASSFAACLTDLSVTGMVLIADPAAADLQTLCGSGTLSLPLLWVVPHESAATREAALDLGARYVLSETACPSELGHALDLLRDASAVRLRALRVVDEVLPSRASSRQLDIEIVRECSLREADALLAALAQERVDMVLLDSALSVNDQSAVRRLIRSLPQNESLPVLAEGELSTVKGVPSVANELLLSLTRQRRGGILQTDLSEKILRALDQHAIVSIADVRGVISYVNDRFCEISGYSRAELEGRTHRVVNSGHHSREFFREMWVAISTGQTWQGEICNRRKGGDLYWVASTIMPWLSEGGRPLQYVSIRTDITQHKRTEQLLRQSSREFQLIFDAVPALVWYKDVNNRIMRANRTAARMTGMAREAIEGQLWGEVYPEGADRHLREDQEIALSRTPRFGILEMIRSHSGGTRWLRSDKLPLVNDEGKVTGIIVFAVDVTEQFAAQQALAASEDRLARSQSFANIGTWDWNLATGEVLYSERVPALLGQGAQSSAHAMPYEEWIRAVHPADRARVQDAIDACIERDEQFDTEHRVLWPDGTVRWISARGNVTRDEQGVATRLLGVLQDVTRRKDLEHRLARYSGLLNALRRSMSEFLVAQKLAEASEQMLRILLEITESPMGFMLQTVVQSDGTLYGYVQAAKGVQLLTKTGMGDRGPLVPDLFASQWLNGHSALANDAATLAAWRHWAMWQEQPIDVMSVPVFRGSKLTGAYVVANRPQGYDRELVDFLDPFTATYAVLLHAHQLRGLERIAQHQLLEAKGVAERASRAKSQFLSNMSHELRTPLNVILGFTQLLELDSEARLSEQQRENVAEIHRASDHLLGLIEEVLDLARIESGRMRIELTPVLLQQIVSDCVSAVKPVAARKKVNVTCGKVAAELTVKADPIRLRQVLLNLLSNAIKYNRANGEVNVAAEVCAADDGRVRVYVRDTGYGIALDKQKDLFVPFKRLGHEGSNVEGTGIGLVITRRLVELMGGDISVESAPERGSTFSFSLLRATESRPTRDEVSPAQADVASNTSQRTILYIEDSEVDVRLLKQAMAQNPRVRVIDAPSAERGLELALKEHPELVIIDLVLPGITGAEATRWMREQEGLRTLPIIGLTAKADAVAADEIRRAGFSRILVKPVGPTELLLLVDELLAQSEHADGSAQTGHVAKVSHDVDGVSSFPS